MQKGIPLLQIQNISKRFPGVQALENVSFDILPGHVHAIVGENGAGKSTLIKILAGAEQPNSGTVLLNGNIYSPANPREALDHHVATIYQIVNLLPDRTIMDNILLGKEPNRMGVIDHRRLRDITNNILASLDADHLSPQTPVRDLSVAEKQIVEICKALVNKSKLLIMDEPTAALNKKEVEALFENIRKLQASGVTIIYVSHRLDEIFDLADTVTVLRDGQQITTDPVSEVTRDGLIEAMINRKLKDVFPQRSDKRGKEILRVENLSSGEVVRNVNLTLAQGEVLAIAGLQGSGKFALGRALFGALPFDEGEVYVEGIRYHPNPVRSVRKRITYLPEDRKADGLLWKLNIRRNISLSVLGTKVANRVGIINRQREREVAHEQIKTLEIKAPSIEHNVFNLSGGNQQKVVLGRCLAVEPKVFILIEPTQGIDVGVKFEIYQLIAEQAAKGKAILMISSELAEVIGLSHRILVMHEGKIVANLNSDQTGQEEILRYALGKGNHTNAAIN